MKADSKDNRINIVEFISYNLGDMNNEELVIEALKLLKIMISVQKIKEDVENNESGIH